MMPNVLQSTVAMAAILRAGYMVVNVNPLYTLRELEHQLNDGGAHAIVLLEPFARTPEAVHSRMSIKRVVLPDIWRFIPVMLTGEDIAVLEYTGGTMGVSKGTTLLHRNLIASVLQSELWREPLYPARPDIKQYITVVALPRQGHPDSESVRFAGPD